MSAAAPTEEQKQHRRQAADYREGALEHRNARHVQQVDNVLIRWPG
jgi:hypothetical protein